MCSAIFAGGRGMRTARGRGQIWGRGADGDACACDDAVVCGEGPPPAAEATPPGDEEPHPPWRAPFTLLSVVLAKCWQRQHGPGPRRTRVGTVSVCCVVCPGAHNYRDVLLAGFASGALHRPLCRHEEHMPGSMSRCAYFLSVLLHWRHATSFAMLLTPRWGGAGPCFPSFVRLRPARSSCLAGDGVICHHILLLETAYLRRRLLKLFSGHFTSHTPVSDWPISAVIYSLRFPPRNFGNIHNSPIPSDSTVKPPKKPEDFFACANE
ncbi:hypothetical protein C8R46DRAFT_684978 [Mycena filopes]|nr:hypothetical protein C8R46DRAFT_684978 [Mycena filopes]